MTNRDISDDLQDVLDAYMATTTVPTAASLIAWVSRYPQYERELTDFTVKWSLSEMLPMAPEVQAIPAETLVQQGMARIRAARDRQAASSGASVEPEPAIAGLAAAGQARGLSFRELASRSGLSVVLLRLLDRRLIRFASIPREAVDALAEAIGREASAVAQYLQGAPTLAQGANYYSEATPTQAEQKDFFDAVRDAPDLTEDDRERWLALEQTGA